MVEQQHQATNTFTKKEKMEYNKEMRQHLVSFVMMLFLTVLSFVAVATEAISSKFTVLFIIAMAAIQFVFQIYVFMHMGQKDHEYPAWSIWWGMYFSIITVVALTAIIW